VFDCKNCKAVTRKFPYTAPAQNAHRTDTIIARFEPKESLSWKRPQEVPATNFIDKAGGKEVCLNTSALLLLHESPAA